MELSEAREKFKKGLIKIDELISVFYDKANKKEIDKLHNVPVFDRGNILIGMNQKECDDAFNDVISTE